MSHVVDRRTETQGACLDCPWPDTNGMGTNDQVRAHVDRTGHRGFLRVTTILHLEADA